MNDHPTPAEAAVPKAPKATTFLMFDGQAGQAMAFYVETLSAFVPGTEVTRLERRTSDSPDVADNPSLIGTVYAGEFTIAGTRFRVFDSPPVHQFTFTPSISIFIELPSGGPDPQAEEDAVDALAQQLSANGGAELMPPDDYGFSRRFAWIADRWGVTWQLTCA